MAKGMISGLIVGGAIGAVSALLLTPKTGREIREDISSRYQDLSAKTGKVASNVGQYASDLMKSVSRQIPKVASSATETAETAKEASRDVVREAKDNWSKSVSAPSGSTTPDL